MSEQRVTAREIGVRMERYGGDLELPPQCALIQALDVGQFVLVAPGARVDSSGRKRPKHEGIVGIRAVRHMDRPCRGSQEFSLRFPERRSTRSRHGERGVAAGARVPVEA